MKIVVKKKKFNPEHRFWIITYDTDFFDSYKKALEYMLILSEDSKPGYIVEMYIEDEPFRFQLHTMYGPPYTEEVKENV